MLSTTINEILEGNVTMLETAARDKSVQLEKKLDTIIDEIVQDIYLSADDAHKSMEKYKQEIIMDMEQQKQSYQQLQTVI
jgi:hypothetical protein